MKRSEIEFDKIKIACDMLCAIQQIKDFEMLQVLYLRSDKHIRKCLDKHRTSHRILRQMDFVELKRQDFISADYIYGRIRKQLMYFEVLKSLERKPKNII